MQEFYIKKKKLYYLCKQKHKIPCSSNPVQDALQALGFSGQQSFQCIWFQRNTLHFFGAKWTLGNDRLRLTFQSDNRLIDDVDPGASWGINNSQTLL